VAQYTCNFSDGVPVQIPTFPFINIQLENLPVPLTSSLYKGGIPIQIFPQLFHKITLPVTSHVHPFITTLPHTDWYESHHGDGGIQGTAIWVHQFIVTLHQLHTKFHHINSIFPHASVLLISQFQLAPNIDKSLPFPHGVGPVSVTLIW
jgi:hypothetical protein